MVMYHILPSCNVPIYDSTVVYATTNVVNVEYCFGIMDQLRINHIQQWCIKLYGKYVKRNDIGSSSNHKLCDSVSHDMHCIE